MLNKVRMLGSYVRQALGRCGPKNRTQMLELASFYAEWLNSNCSTTRSPLTDGEPWITISALQFIREQDLSTETVFEWGSGGSTVFLAEHARTVVTIEHNSEWLSKVHNAIKARNIVNVELEFIPPRVLNFPRPRDAADPLDYASADQRYGDYEFSEYANAITKRNKGQFALVCIDGRARPSCLLRAVDHVMPRGFLLLDNSERQYYTQVLPSGMRNWLRHDFYGPLKYTRTFGCTTIWQRPA